jgi:hypothetical protein
VSANILQVSKIYGLIFALHRFRIQNSATIVAFYLHIQKLTDTSIFFFFKDERNRGRHAFFIIFHYGLDHGLQFESLLKLIKKSNCWLLNNIIKKKLVECAKVGHGSL